MHKNVQFRLWFFEKISGNSRHIAARWPNLLATPAEVNQRK